MFKARAEARLAFLLAPTAQRGILTLYEGALILTIWSHKIRGVALKRMLAVVLAASSVIGCRHREPPRDLPAPVDLTPPVIAPATRETPVTQPAPLPPPQPSAIVAPKPTPVVIAPPPPAQVKAIASVDGIVIPRDRVVDLVMESHGLNMLLRVVQLELARSLAVKDAIAVSPADIAGERDLTLFRMAKDASHELLEKISEAERTKNTAEVEKLREQLKVDAELMLQQALTRENMTPGEFALLMETNTYLRKLVDKDIAGKITDENVHTAFLNLYGENVRVRHIELANMSEVTDAQAKLEAGEAFAKVAKEMSRNATTRELGGELRPFSRDTQGYPDAFKQVAFSLKKPGDVSEPVEANGSYHLIQLVQSIPPKAIKFEDVKDSVREQLYERWVTERMKVLRDQLARKAVESLKIEDTALAGQFRDRLNKRETELKDREQIARQLAREREAQGRKLLEASSQPGAASKPEPATTGATTTAAAKAAPMAEENRPPATTSGSDTPDQTPASSPAN